MAEIRVVLSNRPRMARELLRRVLSAQVDFEVVAEVLEPVELLVTVKRSGAEAVIVTLPESREDPGIISHLLSEFPDLTVLALSPNCTEAAVYRREIHRRDVFRLTGDDIFELLGAASHAGERSGH